MYAHITPAEFGTFDLAIGEDITGQPSQGAAIVVGVFSTVEEAVADAVRRGVPPGRIAVDVVLAAPAISAQPVEFWHQSRTGRTLRLPCRSSGAWLTFREQGGTWWTCFAGTHQKVSFSTSGRTAGRSLRAMRRRLSREKIPAVRS